MEDIKKRLDALREAVADFSKHPGKGGHVQTSHSGGKGKGAPKMSDTAELRTAARQAGFSMDGNMARRGDMYVVGDSKSGYTAGSMKSLEQEKHSDIGSAFKAAKRLDSAAQERAMNAQGRRF